MTGAARRGAAAPAAHPDARPSSGPAAAIIVFDGVCALCNGWVDFLLARDRRRHYRFAAMQSPAGRRLLASHGLDPDDPASFLLLDSEGAHTGTDAIVRVLRGLGGAWRVAALGRLPPRALRDRLYRLVARNRYRLFGRRDTCRLPDPDQRDRFIIDCAGLADPRRILYPARKARI